MTEGAPQFSLVIGGPFHSLLSRWRLLASTICRRSVPPWSWYIAWLPAAVLALFDYAYNRSPAALSYFADYTIYVRFVLGIWILVITERRHICA